MQTLEIKKENAIKAFNSTNTEGKTLLSTLFGKDVFNQKITDRVQTFDDILSISGHTVIINSNDTPDEIAYKQVKIIAEVYNEGTVLKPGDNAYYPWHEIVADKNHPSGFGLAFGVYGCWHSDSAVGLRLCFKNSALAIDAGKKFITIYENLKIR